MNSPASPVSLRSGTSVLLRAWLLTSLAGTLHAASLTWDVTVSNDNVMSDGAGTWTNLSWNWNDGVQSVQWSNAVPDIATFGATNGSAGTVTVTTVTAGGLTFNAASSNQYVLTGSTLTLANDAAVTNNADATINSILAGQNWSKAGTAQLTVSAANTFTGVLSLAEGTLKATTSISALGAAAATLTMAGGTTLHLANASALSFSRNTTVGGNATIKTDRAAAGAGVTHTLGTLAMGNATLTVVGLAATSGSQGLTFGPTTLSGDPTFCITNPPGGNTVLTIGSIASFANTITLDGNGNFGQSAGWLGGGAGALTTLASFSGTNTLSVSNAFAGAVTVSGGVTRVTHAYGLGTAAGGTTVGNGAVLDMSAAVTPAEAIGIAGTGLSGSGVLVSTGTGSLPAGSTVTLNGDSSVGGPGTLTLGGPVVGPWALTKVGSGILVLNGANTFSGGLTISAGIVRGVSGAGVPTNGPTILNGSGPVLLATSGTNTLALGTGAGSLSVQGGSAGFSAVGGALTLNLGGGTNLTWGDANFTPGVLLLNSTLASNTLTMLNAIDLNGAMRAVQVDAAYTNTATLAGVLSGTGDSGLTKTGTGVLVLSGTNTYSGNTTINAGVLRANEGAGMPTNGCVTISGLGTTAVWEASGTIARTVGTGAGNVSIPGGGSGFGAFGGLLTVSLMGADPVVWGGADFNPNPLLLNTLSANNRLELLSNIDLGGTGRVVQVDAAAANPASLAGVISGVAGSALTKAGTGTLVITNDNTYLGRTTVNAGTLSINHIANGGVASPLGQSDSGASNLVVSGTLQFTAPAGAYSTDRGFTLLGAASTFDVTNALATLTLMGASSNNNGALIKAGTGTLVLAAANLHTGVTTVAAGTLAYGINDALLNGALTLAAGTLDIGSYTDTVGTVTLNAGTITGSSGMLAPGAALAAAAGTINATITGPFGLTKTGAGTVTITSTNTFTGKTSIQNGMIEAQSLANAGVACSLGAATGTNAVIDLGTTTVGTLRYTGTGAAMMDRPIALAGTTAGGTVDVYTNGDLTLTSDVITSGNGTKTLTLSGSGTGVGTLQGSLTNNGLVSLTKSGTGTWVLNSAASAYTGATAINGGVLVITNIANGGLASAIGASSSGVTNLLLGGGTLRFAAASGSYSTDRRFTLTANTTNTIDVTNALTTLTILGASANTTGTLVKAGAGTLVLGGTNLYGGATVVSNGTLVVSGLLAPASSIVVNGGTLAPGADGTAGVSQTNANLTLTAGALAFELDAGPTNDTIVVTNTLTINGGGIYVYAATNHAADWTTDGAYRLIRYATLAGTGPSALTVLNPAAGKTYRFGASAGWLTLTITSATLTWDGGGTDDNWSGTPANWAPDGEPTEFATLTFAGTNRLSPNNNLAAGTRLGGLVFSDAPATAGAFTLVGNTVNLVGDVVNTSAAPQTVALPLVLDSGSRTFSAAAGDLVVSGVIDDAGNGLGLTKSGASTLTLAASNTYGGAVVITTGALKIQNDMALGSTNGATTVSAGAGLQLEGGVTVGAEPLALNGTGAASDGALHSLSGSNTYGGRITLSSAASIKADAGRLTLDVGAGSAITGANQNVTFGGSGEIVVADPIATLGGTLTKLDNGTLILSAANTYTGLTTVAAGIVNVRNATGLGAATQGTVVSNGAALQLQDGIVSAEPLTLNGTGVANEGVLRNLSALNTNSGAITLGSATRINSDSGALTLTAAIGGAGQNLTFGGASTTTVSGLIATFAGSVTKDGTGVLALGGANNVSGGLAIYGGTVIGTSANAFGTNSNVIALGDTAGSADVTLVGGLAGTFAQPIVVVAGNTGVATVSNSAASIFSGPVTLTTHDLTLASAASVLTLSGGITGTGNLTFNAAGAGGVTVSTQPVNPVGTITNVGAGAGTVTLSGGVGANVTAITENSTNSALTIGTSNLIVNAAGTTLANNNTGGTKILTVAGGVVGTGNLLLSNNSAVTNGLTVSTTLVNPVGMVINAGTGTGNTLISAIIGTNVTGVIQNSSTSLLTLSGVNTYVGDTVISNGTLKLGVANGIPDGAGKGNVLVSGTFDIGGLSETINGLSGAGVVNNSSASAATLTVGSNAQSSVFSGIITNTGSAISLALTKIGTGTLTLTRANGYGGLTTVSGGALNIQDGGALGLTNGATTVSAGAALQMQGGITTLAEALTLNGGGVTNDGALRSVSGDNTYSGTIALASASRINADTNTLTLAGTLSGAFGLTVGGAGNVTVSGVVATGAGTVTKDGSGTLTLSASNTYTGVTTVNEGGLALGAVAYLQASSAVNVTNAAGVLMGTGMAAGTVTLNNGGTLAPGNSGVAGGRMTCGNLMVAAGKLSFEFNAATPTNDTIKVTTTLTITNGTVYLRKEDGTDLDTDGTYNLIQYSGAIAGAGVAGLTLGNPVTGKNYTFGVAGGYVVVTVGSDKVWDGQAAPADVNWQTATNWSDDLAPVAALTPRLIFSGSQGLVNTNDYPAFSRFSGLVFDAAAGAFTLAGTNTVSLASDVINNSPNAQTIALPLVLDLGSRAFNAASNDLIVAGSIDDGAATNGLVKLGAQTLVVSGSNTYKGVTSVSNGVLRLGHANALGTTSGNTVVGSGSVLDLNGQSIAEPLTVAGNGAVSGVLINSATGATATVAATLALTGDTTFGGPGDVVLNGVMSGAFNVTKTGVGTLTLTGGASTSGGAGKTNTLSQGRMNLNKATAIGAATTVFVIGGGTMLGNTSGALVTATQPNLWAGDFAFAGTNALALSGTNTLGGSITVTVSAGNGLTASGPLVDGGNGYSLTLDGGGVLTNAAASSFGGGLTVKWGTAVASHVSGLGGSGTGTVYLGLSAGTNAAAVQMGATLSVTNPIVVRTGTAARTLAGAGTTLGATWNGPVTLDTGSVLTLLNSGTTATLTLNGVIGGDGSLVVTNGATSGAITLAATNTFTGGVTVYGGAGGALRINHGGTASGSPIGVGPLTLNAGAVIDNGSAGAVTLVSGNTFAWNGGFTFTGTQDLNLGAGAVTLNATSTVNVVAKVLTVGGKISSTGVYNLGKGGAGTLVLGGANDYTGDTAILLGTLRLGAAGVIPDGSSVTNAGTLDLAGFDETIAGLSGAGTMTNSGLSAVTLTVGSNDVSSLYSGVIQNSTGTISLVKVGGGTLTLSGANLTTGSMTVSGGTLKVGGATALGAVAGATTVLAGGTLDLNGTTIVVAEPVNLNGLGAGGAGALANSSATAASLAGPVTLQSASVVGISGAGNLTLSGKVTGNNTLTKVGTGVGVLVLSNPTNDYTGSTVIAAGSLKLGAANVIPDTSVVDITGTLDMGGFAETVAGLTGAGRISNTVATAVTLTVGSNNVSSVFAGAMQAGVGALSLSKIGSGTLTLAGANVYTGATTVVGGSLLVDGSLSAGGGTVTVNTNALLGGTGVISRAVTIAAGGAGLPGGTVAPGGVAVGTLTINGNLTFAPSTNAAHQPVWSVQLGTAANDLLAVNGAVVMTNVGKVTLSVSSAGDRPNNKTYTLMTWTGANPLGGAAQFQLAYADPRWTGGTVTVDTVAKKVVLSGIVEQIANVAVTNVTDTTAALIGNLTSTGTAATTVSVFWDTSDRGTNKTWAHSTNYLASGPGVMTNTVTGLPPNQTNYFTYYATNADGEAWATPSLSFKTWGAPAVDNGGGAVNVGYTIATLRGTLLNGNGAYASFLWGTNAASLTSTSAPVWVTEGPFAWGLTGLVNNTTYYYHAFVSNAYGTAAASNASFATPLYNGIHYVATNGYTGGDGSSWGMAFTSLQPALNVVMPGEEIRLAGHTFLVTNELWWTNVANVLIKGGWQGVGTPGSNNPTLWPTVLRCPAPLYTNRVLRISSVTNGVLSQVTIRDGLVNDYSYTYLAGGGLLCLNSTLTLDNCQVISNAVYGNNRQTANGLWGGGIYAVACDITITNSVFQDNKVYGSWRRNNNAGGAGYFTGGSLVIANSVFTNNASLGGGNPLIIDFSSYGGAVNADCPLTISQSIFAGNRATTGGGPCGAGAVYANKAVTVRESVFVGNQTASEDRNSFGGALYSLVDANLKNVVIVNNSSYGSNAVVSSGAGLYVYNGKLALNFGTAAGNVGDGIYVRTATALSVSNSIFWNNTADLTGFPVAGGVLTNVWYCDTQDGDNNGTNGCVSVDPRFAGTNYYHLSSAKGCYAGGYFSGGYWTNLAIQSPLIDAGDPASDYAREPSPNGRRVNMGAYGNTEEASLARVRYTVIRIR